MYFKRLLFLILGLFLCGYFIEAQNTNAQWEENYKQGLRFLNIDSLDMAFPYLEKAYNSSKTIFTPEDREFHVSILDYANYFALKSDYNKAESILLESNVFREKIKKDTELGKLNQLNKIATVLNEYGRISAAAKLFEELIKKYEEQGLGSSSECALTLRDLSVAYKKLGKYNLSKKSAIRSKDLVVSIYGEDSDEFMNSLSNLAKIYIETGEHAKANINIDKTLNYFKSQDSLGDPYATACFWKSYLSNHINDYKTEIEYLQKTIDIFGETHNFYPTFLGNLGFAYQNLGDYENALKCIEEAVDIHKDKTNKSYAAKLQNLAFTYVSLGEYDKAEEIYSQSLNIYDDYLDKSHEDFGQLLNNVGKLYREMGQFERARDLFKEGLDNFLANFDKNHGRYGYLVNDYAFMLHETGETDKALTLLEETLQIAIDNKNLESEDFYGRQQSLAIVYNKIGRYEEAIPLLKSAQTNVPKILGENHPNYADVLKNLSDAYLGLDKFDEATPLIRASNDILINQIDQVFQFRSEKEKRALLKKLSLNFERIQSIAISSPKNRELFTEINLNNQLMIKGLLLENSKGVLTELSKLNNEEIDNKIITYRNDKRLLTKELTLPILDRSIDVDSLSRLINDKEAELVKLYTSEIGEQNSLIKDWKDIRAKLSDNEVCVEFAHFRLIENDKPSGKTKYVAYVFDSNSESPKMIPLFEESELKSFIAGKDPNDIYAANKLYDLIWQPIASLIPENVKVYYSPSGLLNQIAFAGINNNDQALSMSYDLIQLSSTHKITQCISEPEINSTILIGGINYEYNLQVSDYTTENQTHTQTTGINFTNSLASRYRGTKTRGESWDYLPATLKEVNALKNQFSTTNSSVDLWSADIATEKNFKDLSGKSPDIIHIATHGFFYENRSEANSFAFNLSTEDRYRLAEDPLLRSGLLLAGANYAWKNGSNPNEEEDGILTAMELSNMDLSETKLVVLSACDTGLGDIDGSEGVYGMQRAFRMAGVDQLIMSLWSVPDEETAEFMERFYDSWLQGSSIREAFIATQRYMYSKYKNQPKNWAAFVLFE